MVCRLKVYTVTQHAVLSMDLDTHRVRDSTRWFRATSDGPGLAFSRAMVDHQHNVAAFLLSRATGGGMIVSSRALFGSTQPRQRQYFLFVPSHHADCTFKVMKRAMG